MKKKDDILLFKSNSHSSICQIIDEAIEQRRLNINKFEMDKYISKYKSTDKESEEAMIEELQEAIGLEELFRKFRELNHLASSLPHNTEK